MLAIEVITIFPGMLQGFLGESMLKRAAQRGLVTIRTHDLRTFTTDRHRTTDDRPYGGGPGMVMLPGPIFAAVEAVREPASRVILMSPQGRRFDQRLARELAVESHLVFICGHYEGVDERVRQGLVTDEVSIGDYVLTNGVLAAAVVVDAVVRLVPGVVGGEAATESESFENGLLEGPQYTRPVEVRGLRVPDVLLSGDHGAIARWRRVEAEQRTRDRRPDLWARRGGEGDARADGGAPENVGA